MSLLLAKLKTKITLLFLQMWRRLFEIMILNILLLKMTKELYGKYENIRSDISHKFLYHLKLLLHEKYLIFLFIDFIAFFGKL